MKYLIVALLMFICVSKSIGQETWKLIKNEQGIKVFTAKLPNSDYHAFKAIMWMNTTENKVLKILKNVNAYPEWLAFTESVKLIKQTENEQHFSMVTDYPWPFSNECLNYSMLFQRKEQESIRISIVGTHENVRCKYSLKKADGYILLEPINGQIKITYYFHSEPSQNIPVSLINRMIYKMPFQTFIALKKKLSD